MYASSVAEWRYGVRCAPCGVWAVRACGAREGQSERGQSGGQSIRLSREDAPSWHEPRCVPFLPRYLQERHASSRRLRYRSGAYHGMLLRHREREGMFDVPPRHQSRSTVKENHRKPTIPVGLLFFVVWGNDVI